MPLRLVSLASVIACSLIAFTSPGHAVQSAPPLRVMSFNIRFGTADDGADSWKHRRELVLAVIREAAPDIIGTQEALRFQLDELRAALAEYGELGVGRADGDTAGEYAAILYRRDRFRVEEQGTFWFSETPDAPGSIGWGAELPRICTWARFVDLASAGAFYVYNVHFDHESRESRERSARLLMERIADRARPEPVIVTGDFNAGEGDPAMVYLMGPAGGAAGRRKSGGEERAAEVRLRDTYRVRHPDADRVGTFHGFRGIATGPKIDAVLASDAWEVDKAAIVRTARDGRYPSDHFPVTATLRLQGRGPD